MGDVTVRCVVTGMIQENCYVVSLPGRDDCLVIDPGDDADRILDAVGGRKIAAILLTHGHFDHIGAVERLAGDGTPVVIHEQDAPMPAVPRLNVSWMTGRPLSYPAPTHTFTDGETLHFAGIDIAVIHTPGHTPGSSCFEIGDFLFTGDTVMTDCSGVGRTDLPGGSEAQMAQSLRMLRPLLKTHRVYGGHG